MEEKTLISESVKGNREAFGKLYELYKDKLYRFALYRLGNSDDACDAVGDTVVSAFEQIKNLRNKNAFSSWIFRILNLTCNRYIKNRIESRSILNIDDVNLPIDFNANFIELKQSLDVLSDEERQIVLLSFIGGLNSKEISKITGLKSGSVRSKLSRALVKMKKFSEE